MAELVASRESNPDKVQPESAALAWCGVRGFGRNPGPGGVCVHVRYERRTSLSDDEGVCTHRVVSEEHRMGGEVEHETSRRCFEDLFLISSARYQFLKLILNR